MALATTCPQCKTSFKVIPDQLKLRRGLVRCGVCQNVFSGIDYLRYVDDAARTGAQRGAADRSGTDGVPAAAGPGSATPEAIGRGGADDGRSGQGGQDGQEGQDDREGREWREGRPPGTDPEWPGAEGDPRTAYGEPRNVENGLPAGENRPHHAENGPGSAGHARHSADGDPQRAEPGRNGGPALDPDGGPAADRPAPDRPAPDRPAPDSGAQRLPAAGADAGMDATGWHRQPPAPREPYRPAWEPAGFSPPTIEGPQTIVSADDDLKTAFFLTDSGFGPDEQPDVLPPTSIIRHPDEPPPDGLATGARTDDDSAGRSPGGGPDDGDRGARRLRPSAGDATRASGATVPASVWRDASGNLGPRLRARSADAEPLWSDPDSLRRHVDSLQRQPAPPPGPQAPIEPVGRSSSAQRDAATDVDELFSTGRRRGRRTGMSRSPVAWSMAGLLAFVLLLQLAIGWRDHLAARAPLLAPVLSALVAPLGLTVGPPRDLSAVTIESFELQSVGSADRLSLAALLRNRAGYPIRWPAMELTLTDSAGAVLVRRVIAPAEYLESSRQASPALAAHSEWALRLQLGHAGPPPTGYSVALFYP